MDGEQWYGHSTNSQGYGYEEPVIDLNEQLIRNKTATFFFRMNSDAMNDAGIFKGDILVVDRSVKAASGKVIVAVLNGELLVRRLQTHIKGATLLAANKKYGDILLDECSNYAAWGTVVYCIHSV